MAAPETGLVPKPGVEPGRGCPQRFLSAGRDVRGRPSASPGGADSRTNRTDDRRVRPRQSVPIATRVATTLLPRRPRPQSRQGRHPGQGGPMTRPRRLARVLGRPSGPWGIRRGSRSGLPGISVVQPIVERSGDVPPVRCRPGRYRLRHERRCWRGTRCAARRSGWESNPGNSAVQASRRRGSGRSPAPKMATNLRRRPYLETWPPSGTLATFGTPAHSTTIRRPPHGSPAHHRYQPRREKNGMTAIDMNPTGTRTQRLPGQPGRPWTSRPLTEAA
jgi:hypothetical protein